MLIRKEDLQGLSVEQIRASPKKERRLKIWYILLKAAKRVRPFIKIVPWLGATIDLVIEELTNEIEEKLEEIKLEKFENLNGN